MRFFLLCALSCLTFISCNNQSTKSNQAKDSASKIEYPDEMVKVFDKHGGLDQWKKMKSMSYEIVKEEGNEKQEIDLQSRIEIITAATFESGWDGENYWAKADTSYKGNPIFYTNLMFYFYAMPFVLADEGIVFDKSEPLTFEGTSYPGFRISYGDEIGVSPEDEYFIHYNPNTFEMEWLGYTVTYYSGEKSDRIKWIRYDDWAEFNRLILPNSLSWYKTEDGEITELRNTRNFQNIIVSENAFPGKTFDMPEGAKVFERE